MLPLVKNLIELKEAYSKLNQVPPSLAPSHECLQMIPELLGQMWATKTGRESNCLLEVFRQRESLLIQLGKILDINMKFDSLKIAAPSIPNDISYVKRQTTVRGRNNLATAVDPGQLEELSMFYISTNPAMTSVIATISKYFENDDSKYESLDLIIVFCKVTSKADAIIRNYPIFCRSA